MAIRISAHARKQARARLMERYRSWIGERIALVDSLT